MTGKNHGMTILELLFALAILSGGIWMFFMTSSNSKLGSSPAGQEKIRTMRQLLVKSLIEVKALGVDALPPPDGSSCLMIEYKDPQLIATPVALETGNGCKVDRVSDGLYRVVVKSSMGAGMGFAPSFPDHPGVMRLPNFDTTFRRIDIDAGFLFGDFSRTASLTTFRRYD